MPSELAAPTRGHPAGATSGDYVPRHGGSGGGSGGGGSAGPSERGPRDHRPGSRRLRLVAAGLVLAALLAAAAVVVARQDGSSVSESIPGDATVIDDAALDYSGLWNTSSGTEKSGGADHWTDVAGSSALLRFTGGQVEVRGALAPHHGRAEVTVDGGSPVTVDLYAAEREESALLFRSAPLDSGEHVLRVEVTGEASPAATGAVVALDHVVVGGGVLTTRTGDPAPAFARQAPDGAALPDESTVGDPQPRPSTEWAPGGEAAQRAQALAETALAGTVPDWRVEPGSSRVDRQGDGLVKEDDERFHRLISERRYGGPGRTVTIAYRARALEIRESSSSIVHGTKLGMKWPSEAALRSSSAGDWRSVVGQEETGEPESPGSYQFVTGLTERGYTELSRNGYGSAGYDFWPSRELGYSPGEWRDVVVTVEWLEEPRIRVRYWHDAGAAEAPVYEAVDEDSPFWSEPGYLWLRSDGTDFEYDYIRVAETQD